MVKALEQVYDDFVGCGLAPTQQRRIRVLSRWVMSAWVKQSAAPNQMLKIICSMSRSGQLAPVGAGLGQVLALQCFLQAHAVKPGLARGTQTTPGGDFTGGELQIEQPLCVRDSMSPCELNAAAISFLTLAVKPSPPTITTGSSYCFGTMKY